MRIRAKELEKVFAAALPSTYYVVSRRQADENDVNTISFVFHDKDNNGNIYIEFEDNNIKVTCNDVQIREALQKAFVDYVCLLEENREASEEALEKSKKKFLKKIKRSTEIREEVKGYLKQNGLQLEMYYAAQYGTHMSNLIMLGPSYDGPIEIGDVFMANLDPVVGGEFGGVRSVVVIGADQDLLNYVCVPLSSKQFVEDFEVDIDGVERKLYAVPDKVKIISPSRFLYKQGTASNEILDKMKEAVSKAYALFHKGKRNYYFPTKIDPKEVVRAVGTLENAVSLFPVSFPSCDMLLDMIEQYFKEIEKKGTRITRKNRKIDYKIQYSDKYTALQINPGSKNARNGYYQTEYYFDLFSVKSRRDMDAYLKLDRDFSKFYVKYMLEHMPNYYLHLLNYLCKQEQKKFRKAGLTQPEEIAKFCKTHSKEFRNMLNDLGFDYTGDYQDIIANNAKKFRLDMFYFIQRDYADPEAE